MYNHVSGAKGMIYVEANSVFSVTKKERLIKSKKTGLTGMNKSAGVELLPWVGNEDWAKPSEHPCTLTERAMQGSVRIGKFIP